MKTLNKFLLVLIISFGCCLANEANCDKLAKQHMIISLEEFSSNVKMNNQEKKLVINEIIEMGNHYKKFCILITNKLGDSISKKDMESLYYYLTKYELGILNVSVRH